MTHLSNTDDHHHNATTEPPHRCEHMAQLLRYETELTAVQRISEALFQSPDLDQIIETALRIAMDEVEAEAGSILLADHEKRELVFQYSIGEKPVRRGTAIPWDKGISGAVFQSGSARVMNEVSQADSHYRLIDEQTGFFTQNMITVPLRRWGGEPIGVFNVLNKRSGQLNEQDLKLLTIVSAFAALAIQQARQFEDSKKAELVQMIGDIGHDLKNLLTPIKAGMDVFAGEVEELFHALPPDQLRQKTPSRSICDEAARMMHAGIGRLHDRVREIADCVKGLSSAPVFAPCRIGSVVHEVLQALRVLAKEKDISLTAQGLETLPNIQADERRLYNAFYNLVNNAIPETPAGGSITVCGTFVEESAYIKLSVADTGRGMAPDVQERLFSSRAVSTKIGGTGLGTKIVKDVVDVHRGTIWVDSAPGSGTIFHIKLPLNPAQDPLRH